MIKSMTRYSDKIRLQGIGYVPARPAREIKVGDTLMWNYGIQSTVIEVVKETSQFVIVKEKYLENGKEYKRKLKKDRLVAVNVKTK